MGEFIKLADLKDLEAHDSRMRIEINNKELLLFNYNGNIHAISGLCSHASIHLSEGIIENGIIYCPLHPGSFDIKTGRVLSEPAIENIDIYDVSIMNGEILVKL